jgi:predicted small secreted protein
MKRQKFKRVKTSDGVVLKSGLEEVVYNYLNKVKVNFIYEGMKIVYFQPEIKKTYKPDFPIKGSFIIETKGAFNSADRKKMKLVKQQNPDLDIRFIFSNSKNKIGKKSQTTYGKWCELNNFPYHCIQSTKETFPSNWLKEITEKQYGKRTD